MPRILVRESAVRQQALIALIKSPSEELLDSVLNRRSRLFIAFIKSTLFAVWFAALSSAANAQDVCPDLSDYYGASNGRLNSPSNIPNGNAQPPNWPQLEAQLAEIKLSCLDSSEFFALHGSAQLNSGFVDQSLESLERALLLDPNNGAAQIDYAQALLQKGFVFMALEINQRLLVREDLPENLKPALRNRQQRWKGLTRQKSFQVDTLGGYDNNLNGAPSPDQVTLTLAGEAIPLTLDSDFRPVGGSYLNLRLGGRYRALAPDHQHNWATEVRARTSEDSTSNLIQFSSRYAFIKPTDDHSWQINGGVSHLNFGGKALFSSADSSLRYQAGSRFACKPYYDVAVQMQYYHEQGFLNGVESRASAGLNCPLAGAGQGQRITAEVGLLNNQALRSARLGGDRQGWQVKANWQVPAAGGVLRAELSHVQLDDREGFNELLDNGAARELDRSYMLLQYRRPLGAASSLLINLYRQTQASNIEFFRSSNTSAEIGISWSF